MIANSPVAIVKLVVRNVRDVLKAAPAGELDVLTWKSTLAQKLTFSILAALPHRSIEADARCAELLLAVSNLCQDKAGDYLDIGLVISARALFCRAFETDSDTPHDVLVKTDILLAFVREGWIADDSDLTRHISKLRTLVARAIAGRGNSPTSPPRPRHRRTPPDRTILELVTGTRRIPDQPPGHMNRLA